MAEVQALDMVFEVRPAGSGAYKELVCAIDDQGELDNEVNEKVTRCGKFSGVQDISATYSGNAMANSDPTTTEVTYADVAGWQKAKTLLDFRYYNKASTGILIGAVVSHQGQGRFTNSVLTGASGETVDFSWTFSPSGEILLNESIS
jgi:hypothetical protein